MNIKYISNFSIICFLINFTLSSLILSLPIVYSKIAGTATVFLSIYTFILALLLLFITSKLYKRFYGIGLFDISEYIGGKVLRYIIISFYFLTFFLMTVLYLREVSESIKILLFDTTPIIYISIFFIVAMVISNLSGFDGIVRLCGYLVPICILFIVITILFTMPYMGFMRLNPIAGNGVFEILTKGSTQIVSYLAFTLLYIFVKYIKKQKTLNKIGFIYILVSFILITITVFANTSIFMFPYNNNSFFALYEISKLSGLTSYFIRSEILYIFALLFVSFSFLISLFYGSAYSISSVFKTKKNILIYIILGIAIFVCSNIPKNIIEVFNYTEFINNYLVIPITFITPTILLLIANIKRLINRSEYEKFIACKSNNS